MAISASDIRTWSVDSFNQFYSMWNFKDFWTRANTFDACLCFLMAALKKWPADELVIGMANDTKNVITDNCSYFNDQLGGTGLWVDDFGWCGNASLTAVTYLSTVPGSGDLANQFLDIARKCAQNLENTGYDSSGLPVPGGYKNSSQDDPEDGVKNTVTNASSFLLSSRLAAVSVGNDDSLRQYLTRAYRQYQWFAAWFDPKYNYFHRFGDGFEGMVRERPFWPPDYIRKDHPPWELGWVWTGDQGLLMAGLREFARILENESVLLAFRSIAPTVDPSVLQQDLIRMIANIVKGATGMLCDGDHVLHEAPFTSSFGPAYAKDYVCGKGVLMRYLAQVRDVIPYIDLSLGICASAASAWNHADNHQFGPVWNPPQQMEFQKFFVEQWGTGDKEVRWDFSLSTADVLLPIWQAAGLDVLGAAIPFAQ